MNSGSKQVSLGPTGFQIKNDMYSFSFGMWGKPIYHFSCQTQPLVCVSVNDFVIIPQKELCSQVHYTLEYVCWTKS